MLRLGLQLTLRSGREALVRLLVTTAAVAVGVALLIGVLAEFHAFQAESNTPCWSCTTGPRVPSPLPARGELWNNSVDFYQGQTITRLDVAALGADAPVPPGISHLPAPGGYYASPALAALLRTVPADELGQRFPGHLIGTIGDAGLTGLSPQAGANLLSGLGAIPGANVYPLYSLGQTGNGGGAGTGGGAGSGGKSGGGGTVSVRPGNTPGNSAAGPSGAGNGNGFGPPVTIVSCSVMHDLAVLGQCAPGRTAVQTDDTSLFDDNPMYNTQPFVTSSAPAYTGPLSGLPLESVLIRVNNPATLERVRTYLAVHAPPQNFDGAGNSPTPPRTFGETLSIRINRAATLEKIVYAAVALTLIVAGCSLAVAVGGGLVDRRRPFTLLRVGGTQVGVLSEVVLLEAAVPLLAATLVAAVIAYGTSVLAFVRLAPAHTPIPQLGHDYYALMGVGLAVAFGVIAVTLPLLRSMTAPGNIRFE